MIPSAIFRAPTTKQKPVPVAARSKAFVYGRSPVEIVGSNPTGGMDVCLLWVLSGRGLCDGLITRPEESYRMWRVVVCDQETSKTRRLKSATGLWKIQPERVVRPGKEINKQLLSRNSWNMHRWALSFWMNCLVKLVIISFISYRLVVQMSLFCFVSLFGETVNCSGRVRLKPDGTRWRTGWEVRGKLANGVGSQYSHTTSECGVSSITNTDAHTAADSSRLNWRPRRFKWTRTFQRNTETGFCACAITFRTHYTTVLV